MSVTYLSQDLNAFDPATRRAGLTAFAQAAGPAAQGQPHARVANMHAHSFFSYNALGLSPSALAVMAWEEGIDLMGLVDFDVIDGVDEFLDACELLGVRGGASVETRVFVPEFASREINSPGEPGVLYHMGIGFTASLPSPEAAPLFRDLAERSRRRNLDLVDRCNAHLAPVAIDYAAHVLPLTPSGNATERHIVAAYMAAAESQTDDAATFWRASLGVDGPTLDAALAHPFGLANLVRAKLMKRGGAAYIQPGPDTFPAVETVNALFQACGALPCLTWLDGTSAGEQAMPELMALMMAKGAVAVNIIPNRNWNIPDPALKRVKVQKLYDFVDQARAHNLPIIVGTEMNSPGLPLVDAFDAPELAPVRDTFLDGAHFLTGHTLLARHAGLGYASPWAADHLPDRVQRNAFFTQVGRQLPPGQPGVAVVRSLLPEMTPEGVIGRLSD
jgi:hypothetical protein